MMRLSAIVLERDERNLLRELGRLKVMQLTATPAGDDTTPLPPHYRSSQIERCEQLRSRAAELRRHLGTPIQTGELKLATLTLDQAEAAVRDLEYRCQNLAGRRVRLEQQRKELEAACVQLQGFREIPLALDELDRLDFLHCVTGTLPAGELNLSRLNESAIVMPLTSLGERRQIIALTTRSRRGDLEAALKRVEFQREDLPASKGMTGQQLLDKTQQDLRRVTTELQNQKMDEATLAAEAAAPLTQVEETAGSEKRLLDAERLFQRTEATVLLTGWIPAEEATALGKCLDECTGGRCAVEVTQPTDFPEEEIPILLKSSRLLRPFEKLVSAYGLPKYRELAPTLFVAVSFTLMFGMMFGDVGHGSLLMLAGAALLWMRRFARFSDMGVLLAFNGFSSVCFGALYGSYFGIPALKEQALWRDPIEGDPMGLMLVAMGIGVLLMSLGLILNIVNQLHRGNLLSGVLDRFGLMGLIFLWGAIFLAAKSTAIKAQGWWTLALVLFLGVPILCWAIKKPLQVTLDRRKKDGALNHAWLATIPESLVSAFEGGLLYLANSISFVRLAAYAMSHAALLMATFTLATEMGRLPTLGLFLGMAVIVIGNLLAMALEGVIASVQALRLEYYEFFGKFFTGEGQPFKPFCLSGSSG